MQQKILESKSNPNRVYYYCEDNVCISWLRWGIPVRKSQVESESIEAFCNEEMGGRCSSQDGWMQQWSREIKKGE